MNTVEKILQVNISTYDTLAPEYEKRTGTLANITEHAISLFLKHLKTGKDVLEIGCAVGLALNIMERKGLLVTGIDISPKMVKFAKNRNPNSNIILGDFMKYDFDKRYDGIFSFAFIHLFPKKYAIEILRKMFLTLKPGGIMYLGTSKSDRSSESWEVKKDYINKQKRFRKHWTQSELETTFKEIGFDILAVYILTDPFKKVWMDFVVRRS